MGSARPGADLTSIPGVGGVGLRVDDIDVPLRPRRRRRLHPAVAALGALILLPAGWAGLADDGAAGTAGDGTVVRVAHDPSGADAAQALAAPATGAGTEASVPAVFATFDALRLHLPSDDVLLIGFHEASYDDALPITPRGEATANENTTKFAPPPADPDGPDYVVLSSRGRANPATSAADLVMRDDTPVTSLVSGTVTDVRPYALYEKYPDTRIEIEPEGRPDLRVVVIHVAGVRVAVGDQLEAGVTVLADGPNRFPFASHIDRYLDPDRWPHVHVEVKRAG